MKYLKLILFSAAYSIMLAPLNAATVHFAPRALCDEIATLTLPRGELIEVTAHNSPLLHQMSEKARPIFYERSQKPHFWDNKHVNQFELYLFDSGNSSDFSTEFNATRSAHATIIRLPHRGESPYRFLNELEINELLITPAYNVATNRFVFIVNVAALKKGSVALSSRPAATSNTITLATLLPDALIKGFFDQLLLAAEDHSIDDYDSYSKEVSARNKALTYSRIAPAWAVASFIALMIVILLVEEPGSRVAWSFLCTLSLVISSLITSPVHRCCVPAEPSPAISHTHYFDISTGISPALRTLLSTPESKLFATMLIKHLRKGAQSVVDANSIKHPRENLSDFAGNVYLANKYSQERYKEALALACSVELPTPEAFPKINPATVPATVDVPVIRAPISTEGQRALAAMIARRRTHAPSPPGAPPRVATTEAKHPAADEIALLDTKSAV